MTVHDDVINPKRRQLFQEFIPKIPSLASIIPHNTTATTPQPLHLH